LEVKIPKYCEVACVKKLKKTEKDAFVQAIDDEYKVHWMVDNLPVGMYSTDNNNEKVNVISMILLLMMMNMMKIMIMRLLSMIIVLILVILSEFVDCNARF
jgi:hypothetical protein